MKLTNNLEELRKNMEKRKRLLEETNIEGCNDDRIDELNSCIVGVVDILIKSLGSITLTEQQILDWINPFK